MTENQTKKIIQIFQVPQSNTSSVGCGPGDAATGGCGTVDADTFGGCSCGPSAAGLEEMLTHFALRHGDVAKVELADYSSERAVSETLDALNNVLEESNENLRVTMDNLELVLTQSAPIIAVGGKIVSTRIVPSVDQLASMLDEEMTVFPTTSGCCG